MFKHAFHETSTFILKLFNRIFHTGEYPASWSKGIIIPIFKGGNIEDTKNYRGITLINVLSKIYAQVILNRLTLWSIKHEKIIENQFGFQKKKQINDRLHIYIALDNNEMS